MMPGSQQSMVAVSPNGQAGNGRISDGGQASTLQPVYESARPGSVGVVAAGRLLAGAEHEGGEDRETRALGGVGGVPDLVQVLPPLFVVRAEGQQQVRGRL
jgi:hypothetical protein